MIKYGIKEDKILGIIFTFLILLTISWKNGIAKTKWEGRPTSRQSLEANQLVQHKVEETLIHPICKFAKKINFSRTTAGMSWRWHRTIWIVAKNFPNPTRISVWCLEISILESNINLHKIIFKDEKWFHLRPNPKHEVKKYQNRPFSKTTAWNKDMRGLCAGQQ